MQFISTGTTVYDSSFPIQYVIQCRTGKDIRAYNGKENEILFKRNSSFVITEIKDGVIHMKEV